MESELGEKTEAVRVELFGREYAVRGHGDKRYIERLAELIRERAEEIRKNTSVVSTLDLAILTLLNITDELFELKRTVDQRSTSVDGAAHTPKNKRSRAV